MENANNIPNAPINLNKPPIIITLLAGIIFIMISIYLILFKVFQSTQETIIYSFLFLFCNLLIIIVSVCFLPILKDFKQFLLQIKNVTYAILYTIGLILFFQLTPSSFINANSTAIVIICAILTLIVFYLAFQTNYLSHFDVNYERIKTVILFICLITIIGIFYLNNPGGIISQYFGYGLILVFIPIVCISLYTIITLMLPSQESNQSNSSVFGILSSFSFWGSILFVGFLVSVVLSIYFTSGFASFLQNSSLSTAVIILTLLASILWIILLIVNYFPTTAFTQGSVSSEFKFYKLGLSLLFKLLIILSIIGFIIYYSITFAGNSTIINICLTVVLVMLILGLLYKTMEVELPSGNAKKNDFFDLLKHIIFYIPCLFSDLFDSTMKLFISEYNATTTGSLLMLLLIIIIIVVYFTLPLALDKINIQGGKVLVNNPVYINSQYSLGTYKDLNGSEDFTYKYALSFWVFFDAIPPNANVNLTQYISILNFGEKPNILYNGQTNSLIVTMPEHIAGGTTNTDNNNNTILYKKENILLQKWNNIIINYNGGVLDIFLNGELVKSVPGVVPYYTLDNLTVGTNNGANGKICNVVYYRNPLSTIYINYLYNLVKNSTPPIVKHSYETIVSK